jgi:hypothetical protein
MKITHKPLMSALNSATYVGYTFYALSALSVLSNVFFNTVFPVTGSALLTAGLIINGVSFICTKKYGQEEIDNVPTSELALYCLKPKNLALFAAIIIPQYFEIGSLLLNNNILFNSVLIISACVAFVEMHSLRPKKDDGAIVAIKNEIKGICNAALGSYGNTDVKSL